MTDEPETEDDSADSGPSIGPINAPKMLQTILHTLQTEPRAYKRFGIYWWPIKLLLKKNGYGKDQLFLLGSFQDPETARMVPSMNLDDTIRTAMEEYAFNLTHPHPDDRVENEDGEMVDIKDDDAGF